MGKAWRGRRMSFPDATRSRLLFGSFAKSIAPAPNCNSDESLLQRGHRMLPLGFLGLERFSLPLPSSSIGRTIDDLIAQRRQHALKPATTAHISGNQYPSSIREVVCAKNGDRQPPDEGIDTTNAHRFRSKLVFNPVAIGIG